MTFHLETNRRFERQLRRFLRKHPQLQERMGRIFRELEQDPFQPHLHALRGELQGLHAARIDYSNRLVMILKVEVQSIILVDIGDHDEVSR